MNDSRFKNRPRSFSGNGGNMPKQEVVSITYEEIGLFPRSFSRVLDRFLKQVFSDVENLVIQEYRFYRYLFLTTLKCVCLLFFVPFFINFLVKTYVVRPLAEYFWNTKQTEIFLNEYQQKHAFAELKDFEEKLYFESLIYPKSVWPTAVHMAESHPINNDQINIIKAYNEKDKLKESNIGNNEKYSMESSVSNTENLTKASGSFSKVDLVNNIETNTKFVISPNESNLNERSSLGSLNSSVKSLNGSVNTLSKDEGNQMVLSLSSVGQKVVSPVRVGEEGNQSAGPQKEYESLINSYTLKSSLFVYQTREADKNIQQRYQEQTILLAQRYNDQSIEAITHFFGDIVSLASLFYLFYALEIQINITKSFLLEVFFGLDDSKKSLLILLVTDLLVGYHSSNLWELFFSFIFHHYGLPESQTGIFLLVATLPVLLDVLFKYLIFRHLNRSSPATVATYHAMIE